MSEAARTIATAAGELRVQPLSPGSRRGLEELFAHVGIHETDGRRILALTMAEGERRMHGLRTGYGHFEREQANVARRAALFGRMRLPAALARFRERGFDGVVLAAACVADNGGAAVQEGELVFMHARAPLVGGLESEPLETWERYCGAHTTAALLTFVGDVNDAWKAGGIETRTLTDLEPCPADLPAVRWFADVVLVGRTVVLVRPELDPADPLLGALVEAGLGEVEWEPSGFLLPTPAGGER